MISDAVTVVEFKSLTRMVVGPPSVAGRIKCQIDGGAAAHATQRTGCDSQLSMAKCGAFDDECRSVADS